MMRLPCKDGSWWEPDSLLLRGLAEEWRGVNIHREMARMRVYLEGKASKRPKTAASAHLFVRNWLRKAQQQLQHQPMPRPQLVGAGGRHSAVVRALIGTDNQAVVIDADA